jgi:hypothetical protein
VCVFKPNCNRFETLSMTKSVFDGDSCEEMSVDAHSAAMRNKLPEATAFLPRQNHATEDLFIAPLSIPPHLQQFLRLAGCSGTMVNWVAATRYTYGLCASLASWNIHSLHHPQFRNPLLRGETKH